MAYGKASGLMTSYPFHVRETKVSGRVGGEHIDNAFDLLQKPGKIFDRLGYLLSAVPRAIYLLHPSFMFFLSYA